MLEADLKENRTPSVIDSNTYPEKPERRESYNGNPPHLSSVPLHKSDSNADVKQAGSD